MGGDPDGVLNKPCGREHNQKHNQKHNQRMSQWEYGKDIEYLGSKSTQAGILSVSGSEWGTSSRGRKCSHTHKPRGRNWFSKACGFSGHRDLVRRDQQARDRVSKQTRRSPYRKRVMYLRPATCCSKYLNRSSRPDTGRRKGFSPATTGVD
jgi:putative transposase